MNTNTLPTVTEAQIVAAQLRHEADRLVRLAEQLEATAPAPKQQRRAKQQHRSLVEMVKQAQAARNQEGRKK